VLPCYLADADVFVRVSGNEFKLTASGKPGSGAPYPEAGPAAYIEFDGSPH